MPSDYLPKVSYRFLIKPTQSIVFLAFLHSTVTAWLPRDSSLCKSQQLCRRSELKSHSAPTRPRWSSYRSATTQIFESNNESVGFEDGWQVGNVEDDLKNLERAILSRNADQNLFHDERFEALDYFAQKRIPITTVIRTKVLFPLIAAFAVSRILRTLLIYQHGHWSSTLHAVARLCQRTIHIVSLVQFISVLIVAPMVLLTFVVLQKTEHHTATSIHTADPTSEGFDSLHNLVAGSISLDDRATSSSSSSNTRDYVKCILEQWASCIIGMTLTASIWLGASIMNPGTVNFASYSLLPLQILIRLGVMASLQQYQFWWFSLIRKYQPRPLPWLIWITQIMATNISNVWFVTLDVISLSLLSPALMMSLPALLAPSALLWYSIVLSERRMIQTNANPVDRDRYRTNAKRISTRVQQLTSFFIKAFVVWSLWRCRPLLSCIASTRRTPLMHRIPWSNVLSILGATIALVGPVCHLIAMLRLVNISYCHNASLAMNSEQFDQAAYVQNGKSPWKWRYKLRWREPQRVLVTLRHWWNDFWYSFFFRGSVDEKLRQNKKRRLGESGAKARGLTVLQKVAAERPSIDSSGKDRTRWKLNAMKRLAQKHHEDYNNGTYDDPLGVAVYCTLGIGLGFNFDHMKANNNTKPPSIRRLQSRAAKSAIRRVTDIYNAERAEAELNQIADPVQREQRASALRQEAEMEIKQLADRLTDLVPTDLSWDESESDLTLEQYQAVNNLRSLKQKYKLPSIETGSPALKKLFDDYRSPSNTFGESYEIDYLNPMGAQDLSADNEFLIEWLRKNQGFKPGKGKHPDDGKNLIETILV